MATSPMTSPKDTYLETEVMTAAPQKLQLMLIEAAIRQGKRARELWNEARDDQDDSAGDALIRCQQIVTELLCGLNPEQDKELVRRVASIYLFVFRSLTEAHLQRDEQKLADALEVLEVERETWREVCQKLGGKCQPEDQQEESANFEA